ncbi:Transposon Tf2-6 poly [Paramuricea clavata]|uniref:Transposon Tf2-6 poly n=1 Tax=Paramuricea clavata TaxID=317549 RepID=A0A6S7J3W5_PARCT|nr:Transposon Tf2-6 poly [Paramuricea clavata]
MLPGTPKVVKCSVRQRLETDCGLCSRYPSMKECLPILACKRDIQVHLRRLNLCRQAVASEGDLILLRSGIFGSNGEGLTVCPRHRENLGLSWLPKRGCAHPLHGSSKAKPERGVTKKMSMEINDIWERFVSVGSGHAKYEKKDRLKKNINSVYFGYAHSSPWDWRSSATDSNYYVPYALESGWIRAFKEEKCEESYSANTMTMDVEKCKKFQFGIFCQRSPASATTTTIVNTCKVHFEESFQSNDDSVISLDSGPEYFPTPQKGHQLVSINNLIRIVHGRDVSPIRAQLRSPIRDVSQSTDRYYKRKSLQTCIATLEYIAPGQSNELFEIVSSDKFERNTVAPENEVVQKLVTLYQDSSSRTTRLEMPGITTWRIDEARKHAALYGAGTAKEIPKTHRTRLNHFIDFISQPHFLQDVAFWTRTEGSSAIDQSLKEIVITPGKHGMTASWVKETQESLCQIRQYLKSDFKIHISLENQCADHCRTYALSDSTLEYKKKCFHKHNMTCDRCDMSKGTLSAIRTAVSSKNVTMSEETKEETVHDLDAAVQKIQFWKEHILRTVHQDTAKNILEEMKPNQVLIIMDWAMNFLPVSYRETQSECFGKKGRPWHVCAPIFKKPDEDFEVKTFFHLFDNCTQDWFSVASIIEDILSNLKESYPEISEAFLRSDNAGCYHCAPLMLSILGLSKRTGIEIRRYDVSDAQSGKQICDRRIACAKSHIRRFLNEGNNINTASDMKKALDSYGGVKGCRASVVSIDRTKQQIAKHKCTGITLFNNFEFLKSGIKLLKAYKIGKGKLIKKADIKQMACTQRATGLISQEAFTIPENDKGLLKKTTVKQCQEKRDKDDVPTQHTSKGLNCPDVSCVKVFVSNGALERHLDVGKHLYRLQTESAYDVVKEKWASKCTMVDIHTETNKQGNR